MRVLFALALAVAATQPRAVAGKAPTAWRSAAEANRQTGREGTVIRSTAATAPRACGRTASTSSPPTPAAAPSIPSSPATSRSPRTASRNRSTKRASSGSTRAFPPRITRGRNQPTPTSATNASRPNTRLFAIFLDEYHVSAANSTRVRNALSRFVDETLGPRDLLAVMRPLDSIFAIQMTRDRARARELLAAFEGRRGDYTPRNAYERNYFAGTPARIDQVRAQVTTSALNALAVHLGSLNNETRKTLVVVSEGLPRVDRRRGLESLPTIDSVIRSANRSHGLDLCRRSSGVDCRRGPRVGQRRWSAGADRRHRRPVDRQRRGFVGRHAWHRSRLERVLPVVVYQPPRARTAGFTTCR